MRKMPVCFIACLKVKYSFKKYVHDVENMPKYCADKHKHWSLYKKESTKKPTAFEKFAPMQPLQVENIHNAVGKVT